MIRKYLRESLHEMNSVTWPTRSQAIRITTIVFAFMVVAAAVLGAFDYLLAESYRSLLSL